MLTPGIVTSRLVAIALLALSRSISLGEGRIFGSKLVTVFTVSPAVELSANTYSSKSIFLWGYGLQMPWIQAPSITAQVVYVISVGYRSLVDFVGNSVGRCHFSSHPQHSVTCHGSNSKGPLYATFGMQVDRMDER